MYVNLPSNLGLRKAFNLANLVMSAPAILRKPAKDTMTEEAIKPTEESK